MKNEKKCTTQKKSIDLFTNYRKNTEFKSRINKTKIKSIFERDLAQRGLINFNQILIKEIF